MRTIPLSDKDASIFDVTVTPAMIVYFRDHFAAFKTMYFEQGKDFWRTLVLKFRIFATKHGYIHELNKKKKYDDVFDDAFIYIHENVIEGTPQTIRNLVMNSGIVLATGHIIVECKKKPPVSKDPFYTSQTRDSYRAFYGPPNAIAYNKAVILMPLYGRFAGSICTVLRTWIDTDKSRLNHLTATPIRYYDLNALCADCMMFTVSTYFKEILNGSARTPKFLGDIWTKGNPRLNDTNNPLFASDGDTQRDWRENVHLQSWAKFIQYITSGDCACTVRPSAYRLTRNRQGKYFEATRDVSVDFLETDRSKRRAYKEVLEPMKTLVVRNGDTIQLEYIIVFLPMHKQSSEIDSLLTTPDDHLDITFEMIKSKFFGLKPKDLTISRGVCQYTMSDKKSTISYIQAVFSGDFDGKFAIAPFSVKVLCHNQTRLNWLTFAVINHLIKWNMTQQLDITLMDFSAMIKNSGIDMWTNACVRIQIGVFAEKALLPGDVMNNWNRFLGLDNYHLFFNKDEQDMALPIDVRSIQALELVPFLKSAGFTVPSDFSYSDFFKLDDDIKEMAAFLALKKNIGFSDADHKALDAARNIICAAANTAAVDGEAKKSKKARKRKNKKPKEEQASNENTENLDNDTVEQTVCDLNGSPIEIDADVSNTTAECTHTVGDNKDNGGFSGEVEHAEKTNVQSSCGTNDTDPKCAGDGKDNEGSQVEQNPAEKKCNDGTVKVTDEDGTCLRLSGPTGDASNALESKHGDESEDWVDVAESEDSEDDVSCIENQKCRKCGYNILLGLLGVGPDFKENVKQCRKALDKLSLNTHDSGKPSVSDIDFPDLGEFKFTVGRSDSVDESENANGDSSGKQTPKSKDKNKEKKIKTNVVKEEENIFNGIAKVDNHTENKKGKVNVSGKTSPVEDIKENSSENITKKSEADSVSKCEKTNGKTMKGTADTSKLNETEIKNYTWAMKDAKMENFKNKSKVTKLAQSEIDKKNKKVGKESDAASLLKSCSHCGIEETTARSFKKCLRCKETGAINIKYYCGRECQVLDWKAGHGKEH